MSRKVNAVVNRSKRVVTIKCPLCEIEQDIIFDAGVKWQEICCQGHPLCCIGIEITLVDELTENQIDVLTGLNDLHYDYIRPMDIGASSRSHHSSTLQKLSALGFVESKQRRPLSSRRGSLVYKITDAGKIALASSEVK